ncbi:MAG: stage II sporulation protein M, partial [Verrucomicrobia bacterium]|nr:stage II sporulation protein M [Verrucomicrobiota bacterium]
MIIDLERFAATERVYWTELEETLDRLERDGGARLELAQAERFYYLYQRAC